MSFGIYIVGNNKVKEHVCALYNSIRFYNADVPITLIPYSKEYDEITKDCPLNLFPDLELLDQIDSLFRGFFKYPNAPSQANKHPRLRNLAAFWGPYDDFIYLDADIVVFQDIEKFSKDLLENHAFVCYDRTFKHKGKWVFQKEQWPKYYSELHMQRVFNGGFWGSHRGLFTFDQMKEQIESAKNKTALFDFPNGALAQPILNYLIFELLGALEVYNPLLENTRLPEPWAGFKYVIRENKLFDDEHPLPFLHWAGKGIDKENRYYVLWEYYRGLLK